MVGNSHAWVLGLGRRHVGLLGLGFRAWGSRFARAWVSGLRLKGLGFIGALNPLKGLGFRDPKP